MPLWGKTDEAASVPKYLSNADKDNTYFVDTTEAAVAQNKAKGLGTGGWNLYTTYTDANGNTRHRTENLVAMAVTAGDAGDAIGDDAIVADFTIIITAQPESVTVTSPATATFEVTAATVPSGGTLAYQWQYSDDSGDTWNNVSVGGNTAAYSIGSANPSEYVNAYQFRAIVSGSGASVTSEAATLTITA